jgi:hypothetical protein
MRASRNWNLPLSLSITQEESRIDEHHFRATTRTEVDSRSLVRQCIETIPNLFLDCGLSGSIHRIEAFSFSQGSNSHSPAVGATHAPQAKATQGLCPLGLLAFAAFSIQRSRRNNFRGPLARVRQSCFLRDLPVRCRSHTVEANLGRT